MKQVIFDYVQWQHTLSTVYVALNDPKLRPVYPIVIGLADGSSIVCIPSSDSTLFPLTLCLGQQFPYDVTEPQKIEIIPVKPQQVSGISENTLLKAIAITKDATLALQLIKD
jgi:hypothetical protein